MKDVVVSWEFTDGSGGVADVPPDELSAALAVFAGNPVRVWVDDVIVQRGFIASDEMGE